MDTVYGPGTYVIRLNGCGKPSLYTFDGATPIDDPRFESSGNASFFFQIQDSSLRFDESRPITWSELESEPIGNYHHVMKEVNILILNITPPVVLPESLTYHFKLHLNLGELDEVLWSHDGEFIVDPTIIEKPPE